MPYNKSILLLSLEQYKMKNATLPVFSTHHSPCWSQMPLNKLLSTSIKFIAIDTNNNNILCVSVAHMFYHLLSSLHAKLQFQRNFLINKRRHEKFMVDLCNVKWIKTFLCFMFTKIKRLFSLAVAVMQVNLWHFSDEQIISLFPLPLLALNSQ